MWNSWTMTFSCRKEKRMMGAFSSIYHFEVRVKSSKGPQLSFASALGKDKFMLSETDFKIPIGKVRAGDQIVHGTRQMFSDLFGTTAEDFAEKWYFLIGSMDGQVVVPEIGMRSARTQGFAMRENIRPNRRGFCSFVGMVDGEQTMINSLLFQKVYKPVELDTCQEACEIHINPAQICLAVTYDPTDKWCELAIRHVGMLDDQGSNQQVVSNVWTMSKRETREMVKVGRLVQLQEVSEVHECDTCNCYVKDFDNPRLVEPEPVLFSQG
jgi:hypothetical protein